MPTTSPAGPISLAESVLRTTLADCTHFRSWVGAANQAQALDRIYLDGLPPPANNADSHTLSELQALRPFAVIYTEEQRGWRTRQNAAGTRHWFIHSGSLTVRFEQDSPSDALDDPGELDRRFRNTIGQIVSTEDDANPGLLELAGTPGYLAITGIEASGPFRSDDDQVPDVEPSKATRRPSE